MKTKKTFMTIALMIGAVIPFTATSCGDNNVEDSCSSIKVLYSQDDAILGQVAADIPQLSITTKDTLAFYRKDLPSYLTSLPKDTVFELHITEAEESRVLIYDYDGPTHERKMNRCLLCKGTPCK